LLGCGEGLVSFPVLLGGLFDFFERVLLLHVLGLMVNLRLLNYTVKRGARHFMDYVGFARLATMNLNIVWHNNPRGQLLPTLRLLVYRNVIPA
jgi:hypothetical protein